MKTRFGLLLLLVFLPACRSLTQEQQALVMPNAIDYNPYLRVPTVRSREEYPLRLVYPAKDGHVSITFLFGSMVGPFTRRLMHWVHEEGHCDEATKAGHISNSF